MLHCRIIVSYLSHWPAPLGPVVVLFVANQSLFSWSCMANSLVVVIVLRPVDAVAVVSIAWMAFASGNIAHRRRLFTV
jgi:hypothetical protein